MFSLKKHPFNQTGIYLPGHCAGRLVQLVVQLAGTLSGEPTPITLAVNTGLVCWALRSTEPSFLMQEFAAKRGRIRSMMKESYFDACSVCHGRGSGGALGNPGSVLTHGARAWPLHRVPPLLKPISSSAKWG